MDGFFLYAVDSWIEVVLS